MTSTLDQPSSDQVSTPPVPTEGFLIHSHVEPASIQATTHLAQDTIAATSDLPDMASGPDSVAVFLNPFSGCEELLYVTTGNRMLHWVHKADDEDAGWQIDEFGSPRTLSVVVALHPDGQVYAFCHGASEVIGQPAVIGVYQLVKVEGQVKWVASSIDRTGLGREIRPSQLFVHYVATRPATPVVFAVDRTSSPAVAFIITPTTSGQVQNASWRYDWTFELDPADVAHLGAMGVDDQHALTARAYARHNDGTLWQTIRTAPWVNLNPISHRSMIDDAWHSIGGSWSSDRGVGCVGLTNSGAYVKTVQPNPGAFVGGVVTTQVPLAKPMFSMRVWSDRSNLMHLYLQPAATLTVKSDVSVLHQAGWKYDQADYTPVPAWETYLDNGNGLAFTRPLFAAPSYYQVDRYPGDVPSQLVLHTPSDAAHDAAIYTQQPGTDYWEREVVRFVPELPANRVPLRLVNRYQTKVAVLNAYAAPVGSCKVLLTSDAPVDLEVGGTFYRTSQTSPVALQTDLSGSLVLRVVADGIAAPNLHLSVPGVAQSLTVQPAADIQKFLAGNGVLPPHPQGLSADALRDAKNADGTKLFPRLGPKAGEDAWPPRAEEVLTWFNAAFAVSAGKSLPPGMTAKLAGGEVAAFSLQTHDQTRPACEVYSHARLETRREEISASGIDQLAEWFGDVVEGLRAGVVTISEVLVDVAKGTLSVLVDLTSTGRMWVEAAWDDVVSAAHAVEAMCAALGAQVSQVVEWLSWALDLADVWHTKQVIDARFKELPGQMAQATKWMRNITTDWTKGADKAITDAFEAIRSFGYPDAAALQSIPPTVTATSPPGTANLAEYFDSAPVQWFQALLEMGTTKLPPPTDPFGTIFASTMTEIGKLASYGAIAPAVQKLLDELATIGDPANPRSVMQITITAIINLFEALCHVGVGFAHDALDLLLTMAEQLVAKIQEYYDTALGSEFLQGVYELIQQQAGIAPGKYEVLTIGGAAALMSAFPVTVVYKIVFGEAPFPPDPPAGLTVRGSGTVIPPAKWAALKGYQGYCVIMMAFDAWFDTKINVYCFIKSYFPVEGPSLSEMWLRLWAFNHFIAYGIGDYPPVWGNDFPPTSGDDPYEWGPTATWVMSFISNLADLACACGYNTFIALFEDDEPPLGIGAMIYSGLGTVRLVLSGLRLHYDPNKNTPFSAWNCAINVTSFFSAATGVVRLGVRQHGGPFWMYSLVSKIVLDAACDLFAGVASLVQIAYEDASPPEIIDPTFPAGKLNQSYSSLLTAENGMYPYDWTVQPAEKPPTGTIGGLPPGIVLVVDDDSHTARLMGVPTEGGIYAFYVTIEDNYGPAFQYQTALCEIEVF